VIVGALALTSHTSCEPVSLLPAHHRTFFFLFVGLNVMNLLALLSLKAVAFRDVWRARQPVNIPSLGVTVYPRRLVIVFLCSTVVGKLSAVLGMVMAGFVSDANGKGVLGEPCNQSQSNTSIAGALIGEGLREALSGCMFAALGATLFSNEAAHMLDWVRHTLDLPSNGRVRIDGAPVPGTGALSHYNTARWLMCMTASVLCSSSILLILVEPHISLWALLSLLNLVMVVCCVWATVAVVPTRLAHVKRGCCGKVFYFGGMAVLLVGAGVLMPRFEGL